MKNIRSTIGKILIGIGATMFIVCITKVVLITKDMHKQHYNNNYKYATDDVFYNTDESISFVNGIDDTLTYTKDEIPKIKKIFNKADELSEYCEKNSTFDNIIDIDTIGNDIFTFKYDFYNKTNGTSMIRIDRKTNEGWINSFFIGKYDKFIYYFTEYKDEYFRRLQKVNEIEKDLVKINQK